MLPAAKSPDALAVEIDDGSWMPSRVAEIEQSLRKLAEVGAEEARGTSGVGIWIFSASSVDWRGLQRP